MHKFLVLSASPYISGMDILIKGFDTYKEAETFIHSQPLIPVLMIQDQFPEDNCKYNCKYDCEHNIEHNFDHYELREHVNY